MQLGLVWQLALSKFCWIEAARGRKGGKTEDKRAEKRRLTGEKERSRWEKRRYETFREGKQEIEQEGEPRCPLKSIVNSQLVLPNPKQVYSGIKLTVFSETY